MLIRKKKKNNLTVKKKKRFSNCFTYAETQNIELIVHIILYTYTYNIHFTYTRVVNREIYVRVLYNAVP